MAVYRDEHRDQDILRQCPYNPIHMVASRRFQIHVAACAKVQVTSGWAICPFNQSHRIRQSEKRNHMITCPDNRQMRREMQEKAALREQAASGNSTGFKSLPVIGMSNPSESVDPWAAEGEADQQPSFRIRGLGREFDVEDFINNPDPDAPIDNICLQRLTKSQKQAYYANRREAIARKKRDQGAEQEERLRREREEEEERVRLSQLSWGQWPPPPDPPAPTSGPSAPRPAAPAAPNPAAATAGPRGQAPGPSKSPPMTFSPRHQPYPRTEIIKPAVPDPGIVIGGMGRGKTWANVATTGSKPPGSPA